MPDGRRIIRRSEPAAGNNVVAGCVGEAHDLKSGQSRLGTLAGKCYSLAYKAARFTGAYAGVDTYPNYLPMSFIKTYATIVLSLGLFATADPAKCALVVSNGNFQDLTGLTPNAASGWYDGVPSGWSSSTTSLTFNVINWNSGNLAANLQTLGTPSPFAPLYQSVGTLDSTGYVTLSFNILGFSPAYVAAAAIYNATPGGSPTTTWAVLATATYNQTAGSFQTLVAPNVAANTPIAVGFWSGTGAPGLDNVSVTAIPEPSTYFAMLILGAAGLVARVARRNRRR